MRAANLSICNTYARYTCTRAPLLLLVLFLLFPPTVSATPPDTSIVPTLGRTAWHPGIPGGVPPDDADATVFPNGIGPAIQHGSILSPSGGDDYPAIQNALNAAGAVATKTSRRIVQLSAGTFNIEAATLRIPSYVILRGTKNLNPLNNEPLTILNETRDLGMVVGIFGSGNAWRQVIDLDGYHPQGLHEITVQDASSFNIGDIITIDQVVDGSQNGPAGGFPPYNPPNPSQLVAYNSALWSSRQPYSTGHGTQSLFPDSPQWRVIAQKAEVLAKNGNTITIYDPVTGMGQPLHVAFYVSPQVYHSGGTADVVRYAGLENVRVWPKGTGGHSAVSMHKAAFCWVKNIEVDGAQNSWGGRLLHLGAQTYRVEVRDSYFHNSGNYY